MLYSDVMSMLRARKLLRTSNNPVADYAEYIVAKKLKLELAPPSNKSFDAIDKKTGKTYQIKARRTTQYSNSAQLGVIRNLKTARFNFLIVVIFNEDFSINRIYKIPKNIIKKYSRFSPHQNGDILILRGPILQNRQVQVLK